MRTRTARIALCVALLALLSGIAYALTADNLFVTTRFQVGRGGTPAFAVSSKGVVTGPAASYAAFTKTVDVTAAQINAGYTLIDVPATLKVRLADVRMTAVGGTTAGATSVDIKAGATTLLVVAIASIARHVPFSPTTAAHANNNDGLWHTAQTAGTDITVIKNGSNLTGATHIRVTLIYTFEQ